MGDATMNCTPQTRSSRERGLWALMALAVTALLGGCVHETIGPSRAKVDVSSQFTDVGGTGASSGGPMSADEAVNSDPCAIRLHDIAGAILMYYAINQQMPAQLEDVQKTAEPGQVLQFTCPASGQPYGYTPNGLYSPGRKKLILVYDPTPAHNGSRYCILTSDLRPGQPLALEVLPLAEPVFLSYAPPNR